ncbi:MAG TPA: nucleoside triphosphate pyrophosphatase [Sphingomicrobium sp.]|nr:nucleoside triphosphate pyrophosphatase [Sphingomicrobium sp.]
MGLFLSSSSPIRRKMLEQAGLEFTVATVELDENRLKESLSDPAQLATKLAQAKALAGGAGRASDWVVGSDSVVSLEGHIFSKPKNREEAAGHLRSFSGRTMTLTSAVALARSGEIDWSFCDTAELRVRRLSRQFIADYLDAEWPEVGYCVGVFRLEGRGVQLFDSIQGSYFTILGMPLLPLLGALRERGVIAS